MTRNIAKNEVKEVGDDELAGLKDDEEEIDDEVSDVEPEDVAGFDDDDVIDHEDDAAKPKEDHDEETAEALEELENQELQLLDEEANEALLVDEVEELRAMRREELTLNVDAQSQKSDEFVCQSCFMVKRISQLARKRKVICQDCVA